MENIKKMEKWIRKGTETAKVKKFIKSEKYTDMIDFTKFENF